MPNLKRIFLLAILSLSCSFVQDPSPCLKNLQLHFFEPPRVNEVLNFYRIPQEYWTPIVIEIELRSLEVPGRMKQKTNRMIPNPIEYPMNKNQAAKLLKATLYEVFSESIRASSTTQHGRLPLQEPTIELMFNYLFYKQMPRLIDCFGPSVQELVPKQED